MKISFFLSNSVNGVFTPTETYKVPSSSLSSFDSFPWYLSNIHLFYEIDKKGNKKPISPLQTCELLLLHSNLKYSRFFPSLSEYYLYNDNTGIYHKLDNEELKLAVAAILRIILK
jgi:hypothetical protein